MLYRIEAGACINCGSCRRHCPFEAVEYTLHHRIDPTKCTGCTICYVVCPVNDDNTVIVPVPVGKPIAISQERKRRMRREMLQELKVMQRYWRPLT